jgi:hypothetical protein
LIGWKTNEIKRLRDICENRDITRENWNKDQTKFVNYMTGTYKNSKMREIIADLMHGGSVAISDKAQFDEVAKSMIKWCKNRARVELILVEDAPFQIPKTDSYFLSERLCRLAKLMESASTAIRNIPKNLSKDLADGCYKRLYDFRLMAFVGYDELVSEFFRTCDSLIDDEVDITGNDSVSGVEQAGTTAPPVSDTHGGGAMPNDDGDSTSSISDGKRYSPSKKRRVSRK